MLSKSDWRDMEKTIDFCLWTGKACGEHKPTESERESNRY